MPDGGRYYAAPGPDKPKAWQNIAYQGTFPFHARWEARPLGILYIAPSLGQFNIGIRGPEVSVILRGMGGGALLGFCGRRHPRLGGGVDS